MHDRRLNWHDEGGFVFGRQWRGEKLAQETKSLVGKAPFVLMSEAQLLNGVVADCISSETLTPGVC